MTDTITDRTFTISIDCDTAAFDGADLCAEIARILRAQADYLDGTEIIPGYCRSLRDINGNRCGTAELTATDYTR